MKQWLTILIVLIASAKPGAARAEASSTAPQLISVKQIWSKGGHNAFTDLIEFNGRLLCTFRESVSHLEGNGIIRLLESPDGEQWNLIATVTEEGVDLRDPKLSLTPDHRLMLVMGGTVHEGKKVLQRQPRVSFSTDATNWSAPQRVLETNDWLWRVTWHKQTAYGVVYTVPAPKTSGGGRSATRFVSSTDGIHYTNLATFDVSDYPNEATARFLSNDDCVVLLRRDAGDKSAWIGLSRPGYTDWKWQSPGLFVGGPNFLPLTDTNWIVAGREIVPAGGARTFLGRMDLKSITPELVLPSKGDCSYPGLLLWHDYLYMTYYSSHEGKACIYLAKIKL